jgi:hypothetical protein
MLVSGALLSGFSWCGSSHSFVSIFFRIVEIKLNITVIGHKISQNIYSKKKYSQKNG